MDNVSEEFNPEIDCAFMEPPHVKERFYLVAVAGTTIAVVNVLENSFLCFMLFKKKSYRSSHMLYLALLAFFDVWIAAAYIPLMSLNLAVDYFQSLVLLRAWFFYMLPMITISHIAMTASSFLMVAASFERYCVTVHPNKTRWLQKNRTSIAACSMLLGVACKFTQPFELDVVYDPLCYGTMKEYQIDLSSLSKNEVYSYWRVLFRAIFTILIPFFLLSFMNIMIVIVLSRKEFEYLHTTKLSDAKRKSRVRAATRTLVFVVFTYLLSNILNVVIILWEYIDYEGLTIDMGDFYLFAVDTVSILTIFGGALRLPIYVTCQSNLRREFLGQLKKMLSVEYRKKCSKDAVNPEGDHKDEDEDDKMNEDDLGEAEQGPAQAQYPLLFALGRVLLVEATKRETSEEGQENES